MRVLWVTNFIPTMIAKTLGSYDNCKEGWISGMLSKIVGDKENAPTLAIASPVEANVQEGLITEVEGIAFYGFHEGVPEIYDESLEKIFVQIEKDFNPDIIHVFGTEFPHTRAVTESIRKYGEVTKLTRDNVLIGMQGVVGEIAEHYLDGVPVKVAKKKSLRDILKNDGMEDQKFKFSMRSQNEIIALLGAGHVTGRTSFDKAYVTKWAFKSVYHFLNESLRDEFYEGEWDAGKADRHTIFLCQANYPVKGMHYVFEALPKIMEKYPDVKIRIAGDPITRHSTLKEKLKLQEYAKYLLKLEDEVAKKAGKAADIKYLGTLSASDIKEEYLKAGLFLCPSTIENSPNSLGEAMLLGLPCVSAKVGGVADMIADGEGFLYTAGDADGLAESICKVFSLSDADAASMGSRARERALKTHDRENNYKTLLEIYKSMVKG